MCPWARVGRSSKIPQTGMDTARLPCEIVDLYPSVEKFATCGFTAATRVLNRPRAVPQPCNASTAIDGPSAMSFAIQRLGRLARPHAPPGSK